jgi:hypothetical protein
VFAFALSLLRYWACVFVFESYDTFAFVVENRFSVEIVAFDRVKSRTVYVKQAKGPSAMKELIYDCCFRRARKEKIMFIAGAVFIKIKLLLSSVCSSVYSKSPNPSQQQDSNSTERCFEHNHSDNDDGVHYHT